MVGRAGRVYIGKGGLGQTLGDYLSAAWQAFWTGTTQTVPAATGTAAATVIASTQMQGGGPQAVQQAYQNVMAPFQIPTDTSAAPAPINPTLQVGSGGVPVGCPLGSDPTSVYLCQNGIWIIAGGVLIFMMLSMSGGRRRSRA